MANIIRKASLFEIFQIEPDLTFIAEGLQPGVQYRFMVMVISGGGRMGPTVTSEWIEAPLLGAPMPTVRKS